MCVNKKRNFSFDWKYLEQHLQNVFQNQAFLYTIQGTSGQKSFRGLLLNGASLFKNLFFSHRKEFAVASHSPSKILVPFPVRPNHFLLAFFIRSSVCLPASTFCFFTPASLFEETLLEQENVYESQKQKILSNKNTLSP